MASQSTCSGNCPSTLMASQNQSCSVVTQSDGNLVVYNSSNAPIWSSGTAGMGTAPYTSVMQSDGNYVLYDSTGTALWSSGTTGKGSPPYNITIQSDCNLVIYDGNNNSIWSSYGSSANSSNSPMNRDLNAQICKTTPNGLNNLNSEINTCTSNTELNRNYNFAQNTFNLQKDIASLSSLTMDSLMMGDKMFGQFGYDDIAKQVKERNQELKTKKESLVKDVEKNEAIIERSNRDFSDVKDTLPTPQPKRLVRFIEDYTLALLAISYLFMIIAAMYIYILTADNKLIAFGKGLVGSIILSIFLIVLIYYLM